MPAEAFSGSATINGTEYSLPNSATYSSGSARTDDGNYLVLIDASTLVVGDVYEFRLYEKVRSADTQRLITSVQIVGPAPQAIELPMPPVTLLHGWDMTLKKISGTDRSMSWSIRTP
jgi:hypothetical protein